MDSSIDRFRMGGKHHISQAIILALISLLSSVFACVLLSGPAQAALREYRINFEPSPSQSAVGYTLHVGQSPGSYSAAFDLGNPPPSSSGGSILYAVEFEDSIDLFVSLSAYDSSGESSAHSNEMRISAVLPPPPAPAPEPIPEPEPAPEPLPETKPEPIPEPAPEPIPEPDPELDAGSENVLFYDDFENYLGGDDAHDWLDTASRNAMREAPDLFTVGRLPDGGQGLMTTSTLTNIHSHYSTEESREWWNYEYVGKLRFDDPDSGIGITLLSDYPYSDSYVRLRRWMDQPDFALIPHSDSSTHVCEGETRTGVTPLPNIWYRFRFRAEDERGATRVLATVWDARSPEPETWQVDCLWTAWPEAAGRPGVWSMGAGKKMWDELGAVEIDARGVAADPTDVTDPVVPDPATGPPTLYADDFEDLLAGSNPIGWLDTQQNNSMAVDDSLFRIESAPGGGQAISTRSTLTNIHSHYVAGDASVWQDYEYSGRMYFSSSKGGVGVTLYSDYPESDRYLRLRRYSSNPNFILVNHGTEGAQCAGTADSGIKSSPRTWYEFRMRAVEEDGGVRVQAKLWTESAIEPGNWQVDCLMPASSPYTRGGTPGIWSMGSGVKYWDELKIAPLIFE